MILPDFFHALYVLLGAVCGRLRLELVDVAHDRLAQQLGVLGLFQLRARPCRGIVRPRSTTRKHVAVLVRKVLRQSAGLCYIDMLRPVCLLQVALLTSSARDRVYEPDLLEPVFLMAALASTDTRGRREKAGSGGGGRATHL